MTNVGLVVEEQWSVIPEFPNYLVSDRGHIYNQRYRNHMRTSQQQAGHVKITLTDEHSMRHTRSVAQFVAEAFVEPADDRCDHVVILDGDLTNLAAENLVWRPRWFAWKYTHQLKTYQPNHFKNLPVHNTTTGSQYGCILDAGMAEGLLFQDIWRSTYSGDRLFPYGAIFEIIR